MEHAVNKYSWLWVSGFHSFSFDKHEDHHFTKVNIFNLAVITGYNVIKTANV